MSRLTATGDLSDGTSGILAIVPGSRRELIRDVVNLQENHNGGALRFGPDSMLFVSLGEDARACLETDSTLLYGVILRLDVRGLPDTPGPPNKALLAPPDNPWANSPSLNQRLVYLRGLRNPFRFTIDAPTGRLFIGDVGYETYEEVDIAPQGGLNFGWPFFEGTVPWVTTECGVPAPPGIVGPVYEYNRTQYCAVGCGAAIIGGVVIRPVAHSSVSFPASYDGQYLFSDYYEGFVWRLRDSLGTWVKAAPAPGQPNVIDWARGYKQASDYVLAGGEAVASSSRPSTRCPFEARRRCAMRCGTRRPCGWRSTTRSGAGCASSCPRPRRGRASIACRGTASTTRVAPCRPASTWPGWSSTER